MQDIMVVTSATESQFSRKESCDKVGIGIGNWFRATFYRPKVEEDSLIFFKENGKIKGFSLLLDKPQDIQGEQIICESTKRIWKGNWLLEFNMWYWLPKPIKHTKLIRSFTYVDEQRFGFMYQEIWKQIDEILKTLEKSIPDLEKRIHSIENSEGYNISVDEAMKQVKDYEGFKKELKGNKVKLVRLKIAIANHGKR